MSVVWVGFGIVLVLLVIAIVLEVWAAMLERADVEDPETLAEAERRVRPGGRLRRYLTGNDW